MAFLKSLTPFFLFSAVYLLIALGVQNSYYQLMLTLVLVWAIFGLSWNMLSGYTGLVSFGHASFFGIGAYATVLAHVHFGISPWIMLPVATAIGALAGVLIGMPTFRLRGHYFALAMLAYPLALLYVFEWLGYQEITLPMERENPALYMQFADHRVYTVIALVLLMLVVIVTRRVERTRFGMALLAIKQNEAAAEAAGIDTYRWKLRAIAVSGAMAGLAGAFYAVVLLVVTPVSVFGMLVSAQALTVSMFGGIGTVWGPIIGATILIPLGEILHAEFGSRVPGIQGVILGVAIVSLILLAPEGIYWKLRDLMARRPARRTEPEAPDTGSLAPSGEAPQPADARVISDETILKVEGLSKSFGGLRAVSDVSFSVRKGMILGIIGPNGAGKTTLFNLLNGFLRPDSGRVMLRGRDVTGLRPHALCAAGVGRTFQVMRPFRRMSVADNVRVGAYAAAADEAEAVRLAADALALVGLGPVAGRLASELTTRELRLMELARALAGQPDILLLDETLAGLGHGETEDVLAVIRSLARRGVTIVIIEHTMHAMVRLVDRFLVLDHGAVLVEGTSEQVTKNPEVIGAYLGKKWRAHAAD